MNWGELYYIVTRHQDFVLNCQHFKILSINCLEKSSILNYSKYGKKFIALVENLIYVHFGG